MLTVMIARYGLPVVTAAAAEALSAAARLVAADGPPVTGTRMNFFLPCEPSKEAFHSASRGRLNARFLIRKRTHPSTLRTAFIFQLVVYEPRKDLGLGKWVSRLQVLCSVRMAPLVS